MVLDIPGLMASKSMHKRCGLDGCYGTMHVIIMIHASCVVIRVLCITIHVAVMLS